MDVKFPEKMKRGKTLAFLHYVGQRIYAKSNNFGEFPAQEKRFNLLLYTFQKTED
ncbi:hypothetical protein LEP1GSC047_0035 [Leptospira inadai serovar Lyme str. 10]|uniref:Uncharacterized protein n=1 Tax=Leptospira inadai serovar Lyme str. 10 TaxID=1049790 RepID=V6HYV9_9LEPT|nr:hypothetical protein LEP1GSC047_0035 [Leptospira inadai serovar Lyme str. 10]